ncbi:MAG: hypothetical protein ACFFEK_13715 [Candidatus Thorarchaeota archaeon]
MAETPIRTGSFFTFQLAVFLVVFIWAFIGFETAQFQLLPSYETPLTWVAWSTFILVSITPAITAITWRMKSQIEFIEPKWDFRTREVSLSEYDTMIRQYRSEYRNLLSIVDYNLILLASIIFLVAVVTPIFLLRTTFLLIAATPILFGLMVVLFGLIYSSIIFKLIPNAATPYFPIVPTKVLLPTLRIMQRAIGVSWTGVELRIGKGAGFYTIRDVSPVSKIEGIESVATIRGHMTDSGSIQKIESLLTLDESTPPKLIGALTEDISSRRTTELVQRTLTTYIETKGADEILEEVLEEVTHFLKRKSDDDISETS